MSPAVSSKVDRHRHQQPQQQRYSCSDDEMSCKICLGAYSQRAGQRPRTLHCRHTFCESCLQQLLDDRRKKQKKGHADDSAARGVKCPLCKCRSSLGGSTSVSGLPINSTALQHSGQTGLTGFHSRRHDDSQPSAAEKDVSSKGKSKMHFTSYGVTGYQLVVQRFENFHPRPQDEDGDIWDDIAQKRERTLRFSDKKPASAGVRFAEEEPLSYGAEQDYQSIGVPRHDDVEVAADQCSDEVFEDVSQNAVFVGKFGQYDQSPDGQSGTFRSPSSIDCASDGRLVVVDADGDSIQIFARNGDRLSGFRVVGARAACFIEDAARGESLAVASNSGVSICDQTGRVEKQLPVGNDVVAVARLHRTAGGVFAAAHRNRLTICDRYKPTAVLRSISSVRPLNAPIGHPGVQFTDIVALASTATPRLYVVDGGAVLAVDVGTGTVLQCISAAEDSRLLRQPCAVAVDLATGSVLVCDAITQRVMQFDDGAARRRCVVQLTDDDVRCVAIATGPRVESDRLHIYLVCRSRATAEVRIYQI